MDTLYIECNMGAAGDMLMAALLELFEDKEMCIQKLNALQIPNVQYAYEKSVKCGITGTHMSVKINGQEEHSHDHHEHAHSHEHTHEHGEHAYSHEHAHEHGTHGHSHHHASMDDVCHIIHHLNVSEDVKKDAIAIYQLIAQAEGHVHDKPVDEIHFHEVGTMDAVADVVGVCYLLHELGIENIVTSPIHVGSGQVHCAHGILPVPAPATAYLLQDIPMYSSDVKGELCTPTGAAILKYFTKTFGNMPVMKVSKIGYGMGKKDFKAANCVRVMCGSMI
ncbi:MAG: LarC family nickel insertion protein [Eubacteriales bacterium]|nr:LarC family nickel insertion protein [Eubacteriales bacterium]